MALSLSPALSPQGRLSDVQDSIPAVLTGQYLAEVEVVSDRVRVAVHQLQDATAAERAVHNSAQRQCCSHISTNPPRQFQVNWIHDNPSEIETEVVIEASLLEKLPLLQDVAKSAGCAARLTQDEFEDDLVCHKHPQAVNVSLSCSVWGLVSLLLLLEGAVTMQHWFASGCPDGDTGLPARTLEVCYMSNFHCLAAYLARFGPLVRVPTPEACTL